MAHLPPSKGPCTPSAPTGEHIDYSGFSVCPMALDRDVVFAVARAPAGSPDAAEGRIRVANVQGDRYPPLAFEHDPTHGVLIDPAAHSWGTYFKCGYKVRGIMHGGLGGDLRRSA